MMMKKFYEMASSLSYFNEIVYEKYNEKYPRKSFFKKIEGIHKYKNKIGIQNINLKNNKSLIFEIFIEIGKSKIIQKGQFVGGDEIEKFEKNICKLIKTKYSNLNTIYPQYSEQ